MTATATQTSRLYWFENRGSLPSLEHLIAINVNRFRDVFAADLDADGDMDVLSAANGTGGNTVVWHENDGSQVFTNRFFSNVEQGAWPSFPADLDGDGDFDLLTGTGSSRLAWHENNGVTLVTPHNISDDFQGLDNIFPFDMDGDGDLDVVSTGSSPGAIVWYENLEVVESVTVAPASVAEEGPAGLVYTITRAGHTTDTLTVNFRVMSQAQFGSEFTVSGSASFDGTSGTVVLPGGVNSAQITVMPLDDAVVELAESVVLTAVGGDGYIVGGMPSAIGQITARNLAATSATRRFPYPTTLAEGGPAHEGFGPTLGSSRDIESDGTHSPTANFDGPDDDGVTIGPVRVGQLGATVAVVVQNAPAGARLDAWFDFNRDGNWGGPGEQIFNNCRCRRRQ